MPPPSSRHDSAPFGPSEQHRCSIAGCRLPFLSALVEYRGDLPERCAVAGFKHHGGGCMCCMATPREFHDSYGECTAYQLPFQARTFGHQPRQVGRPTPMFP